MAWSEQDAFVPGTTVPIPTRVLVLGMVHDDGSLSPAEIGPVAEACGQTREQVRSCLRRLVAEGLLHRDAGSPPRYRATEAGRVALGADRTRTAYGQDLAGRGWDRRWRLVAFAVPEDRRAARDALRDRLGLPVRLHDLRHTAASLMLAAGVPLKVVSEALGHSSIAITADVYSHVTPDLRREAADALDRAFGGA